MARMGSYLERDIAILFERIGFEVQKNSKEFGFESDVIAKKNNFTILIQTKQYDNSYTNVGDLLHQWASKGKHNKVDRILIVIAGMKISEKYFDLAGELGVYLWEDKILDKLKKIETNKELYGKIGKLLNFKDIIKKLDMINDYSGKGRITEESRSRLREEVTKLSDVEFRKFLKKEITNKLKLDEEEKRLLRLRDEEEEKKQEVGNKKRKMKIKIILFFVGALILLTAFFWIPYNNKIQLKSYCLSQFKNSGIYNLNSTEILKNKNNAISWLSSNYNPLGLNLTAEQKQQNINNFVNNKLINISYPIVITHGDRSIQSTSSGSIIERGSYLCNSKGII